MRRLWDINFGLLEKLILIGERVQLISVIGGIVVKIPSGRIPFGVGVFLRQNKLGSDCRRND